MWKFGLEKTDCHPNLPYLAAKLLVGPSQVSHHDDLQRVAHVGAAWAFELDAENGRNSQGFISRLSRLPRSFGLLINTQFITSAEAKPESRARGQIQ
jgi:hypothetical protein